MQGLTYSYKASDSTGKIVKGLLEADDERGAAAKLHDMGYIPIRINPAAAGEKRITFNAASLIGVLGRISGRDVMHFTQDLAVLLNAGLPADRALSVLSDITENRRLKTVIIDVLKSVRGGSYLSDALARYPRVFSSFYVSMIRAGEAGGVLGVVLDRLGEFLENTQDLKEYIQSALIYPLFLVLVGGISVIILLTYVIPRFSIIFADMGSAVPLSTQFLLSVSGILRMYWWALILGAVVSFAAIVKYIRTVSGRSTKDALMLRLPVFGDFTRKAETARFARTLGTLINSGVPILRALELVKNIIRNRIIADKMTDVFERVREGERLSVPLADTGAFPVLAVQMITVGEETGRLDEMLLKVADSYDKVVRNTVKKMIGLLEPAMILFMGIVVGFIVISMLMAVFSINDIPL